MAHQPQNLVATAISSTAINLSWDDVDTLDDETYQVERDGVIVESELATTAFSDTGLDADTEYTYRVRAVGGTEPEVPFVPTDIAGLQAWYSFDDASTLFTDTARTTPVSTDGDLIKGLADKSGNAKHMSEATNAPAYKTGANGINSLSVAQGGSKMLRGSFVLAQPFTVFILIKAASTSVPQQLMCGNGFAPQMYARGDGFWAYYAGTERSGSIAPTTDTLAYVAKFNGASSALYINGGTAASTANPGSTGWTTRNTLLSLDDGTGNPGATFGGRMGEVLIYNSALSASDINLVGNYLERWGITWSDVL